MRKGFTLIELLVVMAVIGSLAGAAILLVNPTEQFRRERDTQRKNDLAQIQRALEVYYNDYGKYPASTTAGAGAKINDTTSCGASGCAWGAAWTPYMPSIPKDPVAARTYSYWASSDGQMYRLYTSLERGIKDSQACVSGGVEVACPNANASVTANGCNAGYICSFGITSPNTSP